MKIVLAALVLNQLFTTVRLVMGLEGILSLRTIDSGYHNHDAVVSQLACKTHPTHTLRRKLAGRIIDDD